MKFKSVLEIATTNIMSVSRKDTLKAAAEIMFSHNIRNVLVVDEGITEYGIITVKDIAGFITSGVDFSNTIESLDVKSVKQIDKDMSALDASFMIRGDISYLCVVDETKKLLGIVSMSNIISSIDAELVVNDILRNDTGIKYPCNDEQGHQPVTMFKTRAAEHVRRNVGAGYRQQCPQRSI